VTQSRSTARQVAARDKLRRFLSAYWLRPENAFWMVLRSDALEAVPFASPALDLCCGDGVFSFLHAGGRFAPDFDVFTSVGGLDRVNEDHADMFDHVDDFYRPKIISPPELRIDCGTDVKDTLLTKASRLDLYHRLIPHDGNKPLPFAPDAFETVYCNAAYWIEPVDDFLSEIARITRPGGTVVLQVKLDSIKRYTMERHRDRLGDRWLDIINRGRFDTWPSLCDRTTWEGRFERAGLEMLADVPFVTPTHAHVWDIGLRPVAPLLTRTMNAINDSMRAEIKRDWVDLFCELLSPLCDPSFDLFATPGEPVEIQYVLTPRA